MEFILITSNGLSLKFKIGVERFILKCQGASCTSFILIFNIFSMYILLNNNKKIRRF